MEALLAAMSKVQQKIEKALPKIWAALEAINWKKVEVALIKIRNILAGVVIAAAIAVTLFLWVQARDESTMDEYDAFLASPRYTECAGPLQTCYEDYVKEKQ